MPPLCVDLGQDTGRWAFPPIPSDAGPVTDGMGGKESLTGLSGDAEAGCLKADAWVVVLCRQYCVRRHAGRYSGILPVGAAEACIRVAL